MFSNLIKRDKTDLLFTCHIGTYPLLCDLPNKVVEGSLLINTHSRHPYAILLKVLGKTNIMESYCTQKTSIVYCLNNGSFSPFLAPCLKTGCDRGGVGCASISRKQGNQVFSKEVSKNLLKIYGTSMLSIEASTVPLESTT
jgi:hypothetical protein